MLRRALQAAGFAYRVRNPDLPGRPDLANRKRRWAIFVHGCFWHHHEGCRRATVPKRNRPFWIEKFDANRKRDAANVAALEALGYRVATVWECDVERDVDALARELTRELRLDRALRGSRGRS